MKSAAILKRCGTVLILVGAADIAYMIWCIAQGRSYSSSFNVFALVGGILLVRGGLKTARWVAILSSFLLAMGVVGILVMPLVHPLDYWRAVLRSGTGASVSSAIALFLLAVLSWVRRQVLRPEVREAQAAAGLPVPRTRLAVAVGLVLPLLVVALLRLILNGATAHEAIRRAEQQLGGNYQYAVTSLQMTASPQEKKVSALVAAYNRTELRTVRVSWTE